MTAQKHAYAEILHAIADGKQVQWRPKEGQWRVPDDPSQTLAEISDRAFPPDRYRVKPCIVTINGIDVPEPLREAPVVGDLVYWPELGSGNDEPTARGNYFNNSAYERLLTAGLLHLTREAAETHARALLSFTTTSN